ncbi:hypothetical protein N7509_012057 [Penicillium cosmopolitanum]|uniref:N-acetyltransferase domain-containing protein n=1 Tax=Penicillium cosmopolitanum TaxID=1131564 RepID=A0A9W9VEA4_9EURO|nr:uncharacterized protein N7509_012057 [Penicillium cosmopolitanum]KAJ5378938.1 hypothetical protein N7509_012057 [Penicillium cosmopolitanum]
MTTSHRVSTGAIILPKTFPSATNLQNILYRYKDIRLNGFKTNPEAFASSYEEASKKSDEAWRSQLQSRVSKTFVSVIESEKTPDYNHGIGNFENLDCTHPLLEQLLQNDWAGIVSITGPIPFPKPNEAAEKQLSKPWEVFIRDGKYHLSSMPPDPHDLQGNCIVYVIGGLFVSPQARGQGRARQLINAAIASAYQEARAIASSKASIVVQAEAGNTRACRLYESLGFELRDSELLMKKQNGDTSLTASFVMDLELS